MLRAEKCLENNETRDSPLGNKWPLLPTSPPESPKGGRFGGRGEEWVGTLTQGGARGDGGPELLPSLARATFSRLQGFQDEAAASVPLHFLKNVQSPVRQLAAALHRGNSPQAQLAAPTLVARLWTAWYPIVRSAEFKPPASWREPASTKKGGSKRQRSQPAALQSAAHQ